MEINITGYLVQRKLEEALKQIVGEKAWKGREVKVEGTRLRWDMAYELDGKIVVVEFDGDQHYRDPLVIKRDMKKDCIALMLGYVPVRIPYWIQLTTETLKFYFNLDAQINQDFPHGFITTKHFPASFCALGLDRFEDELKMLPLEIKVDVLCSLHGQALKHGMHYVLSTPHDLGLTKEPAFYKRYVQLGGRKPEWEFNYHLAVFFDLTLNSYTGGGGYGVPPRDVAYSRWCRHIKSKREADLFFRAVDDTHCYS